jgi:hypothetical protein
MLVDFDDFLFACRSQDVLVDMRIEPVHYAHEELASKRLEEHNDRAKHPGKGSEDSTHSVRGLLRLGNQIEKEKAHDQEDDEPLDPRHVGLLILPVFTADYSNTLPQVQTDLSILSFYPMDPQIGSRHAAVRILPLNQALSKA